MIMGMAASSAQVARTSQQTLVRGQGAVND